jgi:hypothetical protein
VVQIEHTEQSKFITFCRVHGGRLSEVFAIPNGAFVTKREAAKLKREGLLSGPSDLVMPYPSYCGTFPIMWMEFKRPDGKGVVSAAQTQFMERRTEDGHVYVVVNSAVEAIQQALFYTKGVNLTPPECRELLQLAMSCPP